MIFGFNFKAAFPFITGGLALIFFLLSFNAQAFTCASGAAVGARLTVTVLNSVTPCPAANLSLFTSADVLTYGNNMASLIATQNQVAAQSAAIAALTLAVQANSAPAAVTAPVFDPVLAAGFWSFAMTFAVGAWLIARNAGLILAAIKRF